MTKALWQPGAERIAKANVTQFTTAVNRQWRESLTDFASLYQWSIENPEKFWGSVWSFGDIISRTNWTTVLQDGDKLPGARWFLGARLNFAENLLRYRDKRPAIIFWGEGKVKKQISYFELYSASKRLSRSLKAIGVKSSDRVGAFMPNMPEAVIAMLATTSLGATWSSCSPDFGVSGVVERFGQIRPKVLFCSDGYFYKGKAFDILPKVKEIVEKIPSIEKVIVVPYASAWPDVKKVKIGVMYEDFLSVDNRTEMYFEPSPFNHPAYIMYSSGTTGKPKCIVHGAGGTLIEILKEHLLHTDLKRDDRVFYQTTCGWMMWNWLVNALACGSTICLYDGFPLHDDGKILFDFAAQEGITIFGTNAKFLGAIDKLGLNPGESHDLSKIKTILSTGSPLAPESFDFVYERIKSDVCLSSISGGTDILGCFALGSPTLPVYRGELQTRSLGLRVEVLNEDGQIVVGQKGELVCTAPFPSMPVGFWDDANDERYRATYFEKFPNIWCHGDYVELCPSGGMIFYGRSDTVLNPGGVRIGTAEIYAQVEQLPEIEESVAIGQDWNGDVRIVLFVKLKDEYLLDDALKEKIKKQIRENASPHHLPKKIIQVPDIPRTRSGKIVELAVRDVVAGQPVKNIEVLANPEALEAFKGIKELATE